MIKVPTKIKSEQMNQPLFSRQKRVDYIFFYFLSLLTQKSDAVKCKWCQVPFLGEKKKKKKN